MKIQKLINLAFAACAALSLCGCELYETHHLGAQTHFNFPNSNVEVVGPVKTSVPGPGGLFVMPISNSDTDETLYKAALEKAPGATMLVDYVKSFKAYELDLVLLQITWSVAEIEGTAVKQSTGLQSLH